MLLAALLAAASAARGVEIAPGVRMPPVLIGTGYMNGNSTYKADRARENTRLWLQGGGRGIDTAYVYYTMPGIADAVRASGVPRDEVFITTKVMGVVRSGTDPVVYSGLDYNATMATLQADYEMLGGPPDLVLMHWCNYTVPARARNPLVPYTYTCSEEGLAASWRAMEDFYRAGKARAIGVSNFCLSDLRALLAVAEVTPHVHQCERHPGYLNAELVNFTKANGIHWQSYAPLGDADRASKAGPAPGQLLAEPAVRSAAAAHNVTPAQVLLQWNLQSGYSVTPRIEGYDGSDPAMRARHVAENVEVWLADGFPQLTPTEMAALDAIAPLPKCWDWVGDCPAAA